MTKLMKLRDAIVPLLALMLLMGTASCNHAMYQETDGYLRQSIFRYDIARRDTSYFLVVNSKTELSKREFTDSTKMRMWLPNDSVYAFDGRCVRKGNQYDFIIAVIIPIPIQNRVSTAVFPIKESTLNLFEKGISGVRVTMTGKDHEKAFKDDKFGKALFKQYKKLRDK